jgi:hypothetical protein
VSRCISGHVLDDDVAVAVGLNRHGWMRRARLDFSRCVRRMRARMES